jgi:hypothetical protein
MKKLHIVTGTVLALAISAHGYGQGSQLPKYTVATLPSAASYKSFTVQVIDGISDTDCTVGGATGTSAHNALCSAQWNGSAYVWVPVASGVQEVDTDTTSGISGGPITDTGTIHCEQSSSSQFGCAKPDGTSITSTGGVYSASLTGSLEIQPPAAPTTGQYVFVPASAGADSATLSIPTGGPFEVDDSVTLGPPVLPSYIDPANVTAIYAVGLYTETNYRIWNDLMMAPGQVAIVNFTCGGVDLTANSVVLTPLTGATFGSTTCFAKLSANYSGGAFMNVSLAGYYVYYTGTAPPADNTVKVVGPLYYNASTKQLGLTWPFNAAVDTGSADAMAVAILAGTPSAGSDIWVSPAANNATTTPTLNANGTGGITIKGPTGAALVANDIKTTQLAHFVKNLDGYWILENPQVSGGGGGTTTNALTAQTSGGAAPGDTFNGSAAKTWDYHTFGAAGISGTPTTGNCVDWASANTLGDTGSPCGSGSGGVTQIVAGTNVTISPTGGTGVVTVNATGGGGSSDPTVIDLTASPYNASPYGATTTTGTFSASATSGTVGSCSTFVAGNGVYIAGGASGGWAGTAYIGTVVSCTGTTLTFTPAITNSVTGAVVQHDETAAFNAAIAALGALGGQINLSNAALNTQGIYLVNGPLLQTSGANAIIPMPVIANYSAQITDIAFHGQVDASYATPIIRTALTTSGGNLFGGYDSASGGGFPNFTNVGLHFKDITLQGPQVGSATIVNGKWILNLEFAGQSTIITNPYSNTQTVAAGNGVIFPTTANNVREGATSDLAVAGFANCIQAGEHTTFNHVLLATCTNGFVADTPQLPPAQSINVNQMWCGPPVGTLGTASTVINCIVGGADSTTINVATVDYEGTGTLVKDPSNNLHGTVGYTLTQQSCPTNATLSGAANLAFSNLKCIAGGKRTVTTGSPTTGHLAVFNSDGYSVSDGGAPSGAVWGSITGTLSSQTDLQTALNGKAPTASPTLTGAVDASGATSEKLPVSAGCVATAQGNICYDSTNKNWHLWVNGVDKMLIPLAASFVSGHCGQPTLSGTSWEIQDAGGVCGVSGGGSAFSAITTGTNTTATMTVGTGGSIVRSGTGIVDANQLNSVPFCTGFTPTNGQNLQYTTASSPNPCYTAATATASTSGIWTVANVTASRVINTVYHNTSGGPMIVVVGITTVASNATEIKVLSDSSATPTTQIAGVSATGSTFSIGVPIEFVVMAGDYYQIPTSAGISSIASWTEYTITKGAMTVSSDLVGSRVYGTPYQNTTGSVMLVELEVSGASTMTSSFNTDSSATPTTIAVQKSLSDSGTKLSFLVPVLPGNYYEMVNTAGTGTVTHWHEITWTGVSATQSDELTVRTVNTSSFNYVNTTGKSMWTASSYSVPALGTMIAYYTPNSGQGEGSSIAITSSVVPSFNITSYSGDSNVTRSVAFGVNPGGTFDVKLDGNTGTAKAWIEWLFN